MKGSGSAPSFASVIEDMENVMAEAGMDPQRLYDMTFFDFECALKGWKVRVTRRRKDMAWFTYYLASIHTREASFKEIMSPFRERKSSAELLRERAEIYRKFGRDPDGNPIERG